MKTTIMTLWTIIMLYTSAVSAADGIDIELNKLEDKDGSCRAYLVFKNHTASLFNEFKLDLVMFGSDGIISRRLAVDSSPLRPNKTSVKLFDIEGLACESIGLVLINDVLSCRDEYERDDCVTLIVPSSKSTASFVN